MRSKIVQLLLNSDEFISGEDISQKLGISRAAVWKNMNVIKEDGGDVEAVTNRGYKLKKMPDRLKPEYIAAYMQGPPPNILWMESVDSTNTFAKKEARAGAADGTVVIAEHQVTGKGRLGRVWQTGPTDAITLSFILRPQLRPEKAPAYNIAMALAVSRAIEEVCQIEVGIKWPNDVVYEGKKLCGILLEMASDMDQIEFLVCGVGINVNQQEFPEEIANRATSLQLVTGKPVDRVRLCASLLGHATRRFAQLNEQGLETMLDEYKQKSVIMGQEIRVQSGNKVETGICIGFGTNGELILLQDGEQKQFFAGEVSVRGAQGYV